MSERNPCHGTEWTLTGYQLRGSVDGTITMLRTDTNLIVGEIHPIEDGRYSCYYLTISDGMQPCGEYTALPDAWRTIRERRIQATSQWLRDRNSAA